LIPDAYGLFEVNLFIAQASSHACASAKKAYVAG